MKIKSSNIGLQINKKDLKCVFFGILLTLVINIVTVILVTMVSLLISPDSPLLEINLAWMVVVNTLLLLVLVLFRDEDEEMNHKKLVSILSSTSILGIFFSLSLLFSHFNQELVQPSDLKIFTTNERKCAVKMVFTINDTERSVCKYSISDIKAEYMVNDFKEIDLENIRIEKRTYFGIDVYDNVQYIISQGQSYGI